MSTKIVIEITTAPGEEYSAREQAIIASLQAHPSQGEAAVVPTPAPAAKAAPAKAAPKAAPAKPVEKPSPTKAAVLDETLDATPEPAEEAEEDLVGGGPTYTLEDAVAAATKLVSAGKAAEVKAALGTVGAKRVSDLKGESITTFMQALEA